MTGTGVESPQERSLRIPPGLGCAASIALGLLGVALFYAVLSLGTLGELRIRHGQLGETRLWLISQGGDQGLGRSRASVVSGSEASGQACVETRISFTMLRSEQEWERLSYCECYLKEGELWRSTGDCP